MLSEARQYHSLERCLSFNLLQCLQKKICTEKEGFSKQIIMTLEVKAAQQINAAPTRCFISLEFMQRNQIGTGDLVKITQNERVRSK